MNDNAQALLSQLKPIQSTPVLRTLNGVGCRMSGALPLPGHGGLYLSIHWLVVFFLPICPLGIYAVSRGGGPGSTYRFYGKLPWAEVHKAYGSRALWLIASSWLEGIFILVIFVALAYVITLLFGRRW